MRRVKRLKIKNFLKSIESKNNKRAIKQDDQNQLHLFMSEEDEH